MAVKIILRVDFVTMVGMFQVCNLFAITTDWFFKFPWNIGSLEFLLIRSILSFQSGATVPLFFVGTPPHFLSISWRTKPPIGGEFMRSSKDRSLKRTGE